MPGYNVQRVTWSFFDKHGLGACSRERNHYCLYYFSSPISLGVWTLFDANKVTQYAVPTYSMACEVVAQVVADNAANTNKAWTDRLWKADRYTVYESDLIVDLPGLYKGRVNYSYRHQREPFGYADPPVNRGAGPENLLITPWCVEPVTDAYIMPNSDLTIGCGSWDDRINTQIPPEGIKNEGRSYNRWYLSRWSRENSAILRQGCNNNDAVCNPGVDCVVVRRDSGNGILAEEMGCNNQKNKPCQNASDCYAQRCNAGKCEISDASVNPIFSILESAASGASRLKRLFAKFYNIFTYTNGAYQERQPSAPADQVAMDYGLEDAKPPVIVSLSDCRAGAGAEEKCLEGAADKFTINGKSSGQVIVPSYPAKANIKFYAFANKNHMPLKKIKVDWGDGTTGNTLDGSFRNHRGMVPGECVPQPAPVGGKKCVITGDVNEDDLFTVNPHTVVTAKSCASDADCAALDSCVSEGLATNFGHIEGKTCDNGYFRFDYVYQCREGVVGWRASCPSGYGISGGCCVFTPRVQATDNWGWCSGNCSKTYHGAAPDDATTPGCYSEYVPAPGIGPHNQCDGIGFTPNASIDPWVYFSGNVVVAPPSAVEEEE